MLFLRWAYYDPNAEVSNLGVDEDIVDQFDDDFFIAVPADLVFDTDHITNVGDDQEAPFEEDDSLAVRPDDLVFDTDHIIYVADEQAVDDDLDDSSFDPYGQVDPPPVPSNNEQIIFIADTQDDDFVLDPEDDLWSAYGQTDLPLPPPPPPPPPGPQKIHYPGSEWQRWDQTWEPKRPMI